MHHLLQHLIYGPITVPSEPILRTVCTWCIVTSGSAGAAGAAGAVVFTGTVVVIVLVEQFEILLTFGPRQAIRLFHIVHACQNLSHPYRLSKRLRTWYRLCLLYRCFPLYEPFEFGCNLVHWYLDYVAR